MEAHARDLRFGYADTPVLRGVDLHLESSCLTMLIGPNGTGKSTLIRILGGVAAPWSGQVLLGEGDSAQELHHMRGPDRARAVAYLPQRVSEASGYRVEEIVALGRFPHQSWWSTMTQEDIDLVREALADMDAAHLIGRLYSELSGGEKQMVLLAGVLAQETPLLLLDEPARALDIHHQAVVFRKLRRMAERGKTICCVTHDLNMAAHFAHRVCLLRDGVVQSIGTPEEVLTQECMKETYGDDVTVITNNGKPVIIPVPEPAP